MPTPGGKSVGRLSVRVVPDTSKLREDLKKVFTRLERTQQIHIRVAADTTRAVRDVNKFVDEANGKQATVNLDVDTGGARLQIGALTRPRRVALLPEVSKVAATRAAAALAALSGGRVVADRLRGIGAALGSLDRNLPRFAAVTMAVANLSSVLLASTSGLFGVGAGLASIAGAGLALPGILAGIGAGATIMFLALKDASTELAVLGPRFTRLQDSISSDFWAKARKPIIELTNYLFPQLRAGAEAVAKALGGWTASLANGTKAAFAAGQLATMFAFLADSVTIAATGTGALAGIVSTLGLVGAEYLPKLAAGFVEVTTRLDGFLAMAAGDGRLQSWIDTGLAAGQQFVGVLVNVAQIIGGVGQAALAAGGGGLAALNAGLGAIAQIVSGPVFQGALITLFTGAGQAVQFLAAALGPIGNMLATLAPTLSSVLATAGATVGLLLSGIASALSQPAVADGISALVNGLAAGLVALLPALGPVAQALGVLATVAGTLGASIGQLLSASLQALAPLLIAVLQAVLPLIPALSGLTLGVVQFLAGIRPDVLTTLVVAIAAAATAWQVYAAVLKVVAAAQLVLDGVTKATTIGIVITAVAALVAGLIWFFTQTKVGKAIVTKVWAAIQEAVSRVVDWWQNTATPVLVGIWGAIKDAASALVGWLTGTAIPVLVGIWGAIKDAASALVGWLTGTAIPVLVGIWGAIQEAAAPVIAWIGTYVVPLILAYGDLIAAYFQLIGNVIRWVWSSVLAPVIGLIVDGIKLVADVVSWLWTNGFQPTIGLIVDGIKVIADVVSWLWTNAFRPTIDLIVEYWKFLWGTVQVAWAVVGPPLIATITGAWDVLAAVLGGVWDAMRILFVGTWTTIRIVIETILQAITGIIRTATAIIKGDWSGAWNTLKETFAVIWAGIVSVVENSLGTVAQLFGSLKTTIGNVFSAAGTWLIDVGKAIIQGLIDGIKASFKLVKDTLGNLTDLLPDWKGPAAVDAKLLTGNGRLIMQSLVAGFKDEAPAVQKYLTRFTADLANGSNSALAAAAAYTPATANGPAGALAAGVVLSGNFYSYDPSQLAAEAQKKQRDAQAVARLRSITAAR